MVLEELHFFFSFPVRVFVGGDEAIGGLELSSGRGDCVVGINKWRGCRLVRGTCVIFFVSSLVSA